jgi:hypothetical protein
MKIYKTSNYTIDITEYEAVRETKDFYIVISKYNGKEEREAKTSSFYIYHATRNLAENYLLNRIDRDIRYAKEKIERLEADRKKVIENAEK